MHRPKSLIPVLAVLGVLIGAAVLPDSAWSIIVPILGHSSVAGGPPVTYISPIYYDQLAHPNWNAYMDSTSPTVRSFFLAHVGRIFTFTPYFDNKLSWYPNARVYVDVSVIYSTETALVDAHPDWVLRDGGGVALFNPSGVGGGTGPEYAANIASAAFRADKIAGIGAALAGVSGMAPTPYLGFFLDDVNTDITVTDGFGTPVTPIDTNTGLPMTQNAWSGYMVALVQGIRAAYPTAELTQNSVWFSDALSSDIALQIAASDRIFCERGFGDTGLSGGPGGSLRAFMDYVDTVHAAGKPVNIDDYFVSNLHYSTAGYLLGWAPGDHLEFDDLLPDPAVWPSVLFGMPLGTPTAARFQPNSGTYPRLWRRDYQNGVALLNEPGAGSITYPLGGTYQDDTGTTMTSITLGAMQGAVLKKVSSPPPPLLLSAFPGATGGGAASVGGRGGAVIEVTNLNDSGTGSFRAAVAASGPRTVIFKVGGLITLNSTVTISNPYITIAGQTAPGSGITLRIADGVDINEMIEGETHDVIIRYIRLRPGRGGISTRSRGGIFFFGAAYNVMVDHVSSSWSAYDMMGTWSISGIQHDMTFSYNMMTDGLAYDPVYHAKAFNTGSDNATYIVQMTNIDLHHNYMATNENRAPLARNKSMRLVSNLIYNNVYGDMTPSCGIDIDIISNKVVRGPDYDGYDRKEVGWEQTGSSDCPPGDPTIYITGNLGPHNSSLTADNWSSMMAMVMAGEYHSDSGAVSIGFRRTIPLATQARPIVATAADILDTILFTAGRDGVGASARLEADGSWTPNWDDVDLRHINEYQTNTGPAVPPTSETDDGGYPTYIAGTGYTDTDHDGMSDVWEMAHGLNPSDPSDGPVITSSGYSNLELFLAGVTLPPNIGPVLLSHVKQTGSGVSTAAINTTGATLLACAIAGDVTSYTVSDSGGNTWVAGTVRTNIVDTIIYYSYNKAGGALSVSTSHTFTATGGGFLAVECGAWSGTLTGATNPFDTQTGGTGNVIPTHSGTLTPGTGNYHLIISSLGENNTAGFMSGASASGMTVTDTNNYAGGVNYGGSLAYTVQPGAATPIDTGWTPIGSAGCNCAVAIMSFKAP